MPKFTSKVLEILDLTPTVKHFKLSMPDGMKIRPGQFITTDIYHDNKKVKRSYSIASDCDKDYIDLVIKEVKGGPGTTYFFNLKEGDEITSFGPIGPFKLENENKDMIFIATGTGIGPFRSMISYLLRTGCNKKILLLTGYRYEEEELYVDWKKNLKEKYPNFNYDNIISRPKVSTKEKGRVQKLVEKHVTKEFTGDFYLCGLTPMIEEVTDLLLKKGFSKEQIFFERYD